MSDGVDVLIERLGMKPHPEGGFFVETYRSKASTAIYFLLAPGHVSHLHRLKVDEVWHHYMGGPLQIAEIPPNGKVRETRLGKDLTRTEKPQHVVPAGSWFGAYLAPSSPYALVGCTVAPAFSFDEFELGHRATLLREFPLAREVIQLLTRPD